MFSKNMRAIYQRLLILGLLSMCLFVFGYSDAVESVYAAPCVQECETNQGYCNGECQSACNEDSTDAACTSCITTCNSQFLSCLSNAVWCDNEVSQPGRCTVYYTDHCPIIGGDPDCDDQSAHAGYSLICNTTGNQQCVSCPDHHYCSGSNGLPGCFN